MDHKEIIETWGWRIKKAKLSQKEFAQKIQKPEGALSFWLRGLRKPNLDSFETIENTLRDLGV